MLDDITKDKTGFSVNDIRYGHGMIRSALDLSMNLNNINPKTYLKDNNTVDFRKFMEIMDSLRKISKKCALNNIKQWDNKREIIFNKLHQKQIKRSQHKYHIGERILLYNKSNKVGNQLTYSQKWVPGWFIHKIIKDRNTFIITDGKKTKPVHRSMVRKYYVYDNYDIPEMYKSNSCAKYLALLDEINNEQRAE